jgi:ribosomal protein S18 acetylase RimI-like enzyme
VALDIRVRPYRLPADMDALVRIWEDSEDHHEAIDPQPPLVPRSIEATRRRFEQLKVDPQRALLVAEVDGAVVGLAEATLRRDESNGFVGAYVNELAVASGWRGRGIGTRLLAEVEQWGRDNGALAMALDTLVTNAGARRLYERLGFRVRAVVMGKRLPRP